MMYARYVALDDITFVGDAFTAQWEECLRDRPFSAFIVSEPGEAQYPHLYCWFSQTRFTRRELAQLCQWDDAPLQHREAQGEARQGFLWRIEEVEMQPQTQKMADILKTVGVLA